MKLSKLAKNLELEFSGKDFLISSFATLEGATHKQIAYIDNEKFLEKLKNTKAGVVILKKEFLEFLPETSSALISENPHLSMAYASKYFAKKPFHNSEKGKNISLSADIDKSATICDNTVIEKNVHIMAGAVIGANVKIGKNSVIYPNVVIYDNTVIGKNCIIHSGAVIGSDGYGYVPTEQGEHIKIYHFGNVILQDNVEIGSNTSVDRGVFGATVIGEGTKIDNLVQVAHNSTIGPRCILVSQTGISGSTKLGRNVIMGGQSATAGHLEIGDFATIAARGGVTKSVAGGKVYAGFPLTLHKEWLKAQVKMARFFRK
jgi:UDP-3-O-[3-hydroxymyristoyl] glucosamine N-acyltransferase